MAEKYRGTSPKELVGAQPAKPLCLLEYGRQDPFPSRPESPGKQALVAAVSASE